MRPNKLNTRRRNLSISDADYARLQQLGAGNASEGVRVALRLVHNTTKQEREG